MEEFGPNDHQQPLPAFFPPDERVAHADGAWAFSRRRPERFGRFDDIKSSSFSAIFGHSVLKRKKRVAKIVISDRARDPQGRFSSGMRPKNFFLGGRVCLIILSVDD